MQCHNYSSVCNNDNSTGNRHDSHCICIFSVVLQIRPTGGYVAIPGGNAVFNCLYFLSGCSDRLVSVQWLVNGTLLDSTNLTNINTVFDGSIACGTGSLTFTNISLEYNMTSVSCRADLNSGRIITSNTNVLLLLQGDILIRIMNANHASILDNNNDCEN